MPARRVLFIDATKLSALRWNAGQIDVEAEFTADAAGFEAFAAYLRTHRGSLFHILADVADEGFQIEEVPSLGGGDRAAFLKRKLGQYYYGTPLSTAISLGRLKEGRRDERILFAALTRPQHFEPWLAALATAQAALVGIYSLPLLAAQLVVEPAKQHKQFLLLTISSGGLRQSYFEDGQLRFSRLTTLATGSIDESSIACAIEAAKIYQYLTAQRLIGRGTSLPVYILAHPVHANAFRERCRNSDELRFDLLDLLVEAKRCGLKTTPRDSACQALFAHLVVRNTPRDQFAAEADRRFYRYWQTRFALTSAGFVIFTACLLFGAKTLLDTQRLQEDIAATKAQTEQDRRRYQTVLEGLPKIPLTTDNLGALVGRSEELKQRSPGLEPLLFRLGNALQGAPQIEIERLHWAIANRIEDFGTLPGDKATVPAKAAEAGSGGPFAVIEVQGTLPVTMAGDHRGQLEVINGFSDRLKTGANTQVRVLSLPFDAESGKAIKSSGGSATVEIPRFVLRVAQPL